VVIKESKINLSIKNRCAVLKVNKSSYYKWLQPKLENADNIEKEIVAVYHKHKGTYGRQRITQALKNSGVLINHKKVYRVLKKNGLKAVIRKKYCCRKYKKENVVPNIINREFKADKPLRKLVCDVTELKRLNDRRYFLYSIMDLYNNKIIAANVSYSNDWGLVANCLKELQMNNAEVVLHSDQGPQFTSKLYKEITQQKNITISMSRVGNCYDNAAKESFFGHFKEEFYIFYNPKTQDELYKNIKEFIYYYNYERIQMRFKMSPMQYLSSSEKYPGIFELST